MLIQFIFHRATGERDYVHNREPRTRDDYNKMQMRGNEGTAEAVITPILRGFISFHYGKRYGHSMKHKLSAALLFDKKLSLMRRRIGGKGRRRKVVCITRLCSCEWFAGEEWTRFERAVKTSVAHLKCTDQSHLVLRVEFHQNTKQPAGDFIIRCSILRCENI